MANSVELTGTNNGLERGQAIQSANGIWELRFGNDGRLRLRNLSSGTTAFDFGGNALADSVNMSLASGKLVVAIKGRSSEIPLTGGLAVAPRTIRVNDDGKCVVLDAGGNFLAFLTSSVVIDNPNDGLNPVNHG